MPASSRLLLIRYPDTAVHGADMAFGLVTLNRMKGPYTLACEGGGVLGRKAARREQVSQPLISPPAQQNISMRPFRSVNFTQCVVPLGTTSGNPADGNPPSSVSLDSSAIAWGKWNHISTKRSSASSPHYRHNPTNCFSVLDLKPKHVTVVVMRKTQSDSAGSNASICAQTRLAGCNILPSGVDS
ncbi:unnamed protein product [Bubo scandiacus]